MKDVSNESLKGGSTAVLRRRRDAQQWRALLAQQAVSGLSVAAFCRQQALSEASFYAWRRRLRSSADSPPTGVATKGDGATCTDAAMNGDALMNASGFVRLEPFEHASGMIEVRFDCGATLRCSSDALEQLVDALARKDRSC